MMVKFSKINNFRVFSKQVYNWQFLLLHGQKTNQLVYAYSQL